MSGLEKQHVEWQKFLLMEHVYCTQLSTFPNRLECLLSSQCYLRIFAQTQVWGAFRLYKSAQIFGFLIPKFHCMRWVRDWHEIENIWLSWRLELSNVMTHPQERGTTKMHGWVVFFVGRDFSMMTGSLLHIKPYLFSMNESELLNSENFIKLWKSSRKSQYLAKASDARGSTTPPQGTPQHSRSPP